jgi:SAM-dependent methyltransferase
MQDGLPIPPPELLGRIGPMGEVDPVAVYRESGRAHRELLESVLPADWSWAGKRVLDFGCGVGRMLRQFEAEAAEAEFWGCDLDDRSVDWLQQGFCPPFKVFESAEEAGLPQPDGYFDLIYAFSVYTHFTDNWASWLLEHHRVLADGGLLFATFLGEGMLEALTGEKWDEDQIGMNPLMHGYPWDLGGPIAINSPWWIRLHWGRAFEIAALLPRVGDDGSPSHGIVLARKKPAQVTVEEMKALDLDEPRELKALEHHVDQLAGEVQRLHEVGAAQGKQLQRLPALERAYAEIEASSSWRLTAPLRALKQRVRPQ